MTVASTPGFASPGSRSMDRSTNPAAPLRVLLLEDMPTDAEMTLR